MNRPLQQQVPALLHDQNDYSGWRSCKNAATNHTGRYRVYVDFGMARCCTDSSPSLERYHFMQPVFAGVRKILCVLIHVVISDRSKYLADVMSTTC
jgi:hypothetical protein